MATNLARCAKTSFKSKACLSSSERCNREVDDTTSAEVHAQAISAHIACGH